MKNVFDELISWLDMAEEIISELQDISIDFMKIKKQREQRLEIKISKGCGTTTKGLMHVWWE